MYQREILVRKEIKEWYESNGGKNGPELGTEIWRKEGRDLLMQNTECAK